MEYTGREAEVAGLYYYRARYYHPIWQRFLSEDPVEFQGSDTNLYTYVTNNPMTSVDPSGAIQVALPQGLVDFCRSEGAWALSGRKNGELLARLAELGLGVLRETGCDPATAVLMTGVVTGPTKGMIKQLTKQMTEQGRKSVERSLRTFERRLMEHAEKLRQIEAAGGPPGSVEREIRNFKALIEAAKSVLERVP